MKLFKHQSEGVDFLASRGRAILADEMGLGKTVQAIEAAKRTAKGVLVVCQASTKINWKREIARCGIEARIMGTGKGGEPAEGRSWHIVNYDILQKMMPEIEAMIEAGTLDTAILDEAQSIKGRSLRSACIVGGNFAPKGGEKVRHPGIASKMRQVYCLTGTPIMNRPIELFNQLKAVGHPLASNRDAYARRYCGAFTMVQVMNLATGRKFMTDQSKAYQFYGDRKKFRHLLRFPNEQGATNLDELRRMISDVMLRRRKKDVLDLPDKVVSVVECEMDEEWRKRYDSAWTAYVEFLERTMPAGEESRQKMENIMSAQSLVEIQKLKQVASLAKCARIVEDVKRAHEAEQKCIVFSQYTETIRTIESMLKSEGVGCVTLTGADGMEERQESIDAFQKDPKVQAFVANIKAGGVGITLTAASMVMFADMEWSPEIHAQAEDRAHRIGQEGTVNVYYYLCEDTVDEDIMAVLDEKKQEISQVIDGKGKRAKTGSMQAAFAERLARRSVHR